MEISKYLTVVRQKVDIDKLTTTTKKVPLLKAVLIQLIELGEVSWCQWNFYLLVLVSLVQECILQTTKPETPI